MSFLTAELPNPDSGSTVHFERPGDTLIAQFLERKTGLKTKVGEDKSLITVYVVNSNIPGLVNGDNAAVWEGTHIKQIIGDASLSRGDGFVLRFMEQTKTRFKKFAFKKLTFDELKAEAKEVSVELPEAPNEN